MTEDQSAAEIAASHARHYAALLAAEEPGTPGWQFVFGQLSATSTLANALRGHRLAAGPAPEPAAGPAQCGCCRGGPENN